MNLKRLIVILGLPLLLVSCSFQNRDNLNTKRESINCSDVTHRAGKTRICGRPQRIITLNAKMLDILLALEIQPIGYAQVFSNLGKDFDRPAEQIPYLGSKITRPIVNLGISESPSLEAIARLKPDLILGDIRGNKDDHAQLSQIAPTLLFEYVGYDKWQEPLERLGEITGRTDRAKTVIQEYQERKKKTRQNLASITKKYPKALVLTSGNLSEIYLVKTAEFCGGILSDIGFNLVSLPGEGGSAITAPISIEALPQLNPDIIFVQGSDLAQLKKITSIKDFTADQLQPILTSWKSNPITKSLVATQSDRVFFIPTYICLGLPSPTGAEIILQELNRQVFRIK